MFILKSALKLVEEIIHSPVVIKILINSNKISVTLTKTYSSGEGKGKFVALLHTKAIGSVEMQLHSFFTSARFRCESSIYKLKLLSRLNSIKYSRATYCVKWLNGKEVNVLRFISVVFIRKMTTSEIFKPRPLWNPGSYYI